METTRRFPVNETHASARAAGIAVALIALVVGVAMIALGLSTPVARGTQVIESAIGLIASLAGRLLLRNAMKGTAEIKTAGPLGDLIVLCAFLYFGVMLPPFNQGLVQRSTAQLQFGIVLVGLIAGTSAFALNRPPAPRSVHGGKKFAQVFLAADGVVLVVGTIVLGIGLGLLDKAIFMPPKWSWISFLGLTVPGMVLLIVARGAAKRLSPPAQSLGRKTSGIGFVLGWELLLVAGLALMIYGAVYNLTLGTNGFHTGFKGNTGGLTLWIAAAAALVFIRGPFEHALIRLRERPWYSVWYPVAREFLYAAAAAAFIIGERSVIVGKPPSIAIGHAFPAAALVIVGALFLLIPIRLAVKPPEDEVSGVTI